MRATSTGRSRTHHHIAASIDIKGARVVTAKGSQIDHSGRTRPTEGMARRPHDNGAIAIHRLGNACAKIDHSRGSFPQKGVTYAAGAGDAYNNIPSTVHIIGLYIPLASPAERTEIDNHAILPQKPM